MILNLSKIKTEALLLFCKDLISSYEDKEDEFFDVDSSVSSYINEITKDIYKQLENCTFPNEYYLKNIKHYRIKAVLNAYNFINSEVSKNLGDGDKGKLFNPTMLYFSLLAVWFKELDKESKSKQYLFFTIYPYSKIYDKLLLNIQDKNFKLLNIAMIELAEKIIYKLDKLSLK